MDLFNSLKNIAEQFCIDSVRDVAPLGEGLMHDTYLVTTADERFVLQRQSPVFGREVLDDMVHVTERLASLGYKTPKIVRAENGMFVVECDGDVWRMQTFIPGRTVERGATLEEIHHAAALLGRFHAAFNDDQYAFRHVLKGFHDTPLAISAMTSAMARHYGTRRYTALSPIVRPVTEMYRSINYDALRATPVRIVHGDPKLNNIRFSETSPETLCFIDLDTVMRDPVGVDSGDAMRSWCNPAGGTNLEDVRFDEDCFKAFMRGYVSTASFLRAQERRSIVEYVLLITLELAARYVTDALNETYFRFDSKRFASLYEQNMVRASVQCELAIDICTKRQKLEEILQEVVLLNTFMQ